MSRAGSTGCGTAVPGGGMVIPSCWKASTIGVPAMAALRTSAIVAVGALTKPPSGSRTVVDSAAGPASAGGGISAGCPSATGASVSRFARRFVEGVLARRAARPVGRRPRPAARSAPLRSGVRSEHLARGTGQRGCGQAGCHRRHREQGRRRLHRHWRGHRRCHSAGRGIGSGRNRLSLSK